MTDRIRTGGVRQRWGILWHSENSLDGVTKHLMWNHGTTPCLFRTRQEARDYRDEKWGYIRRRKDLRIEPHGWRLPRVVKVRVEWTVI